ncbi:hypothetical protein GCM10011494_20530 [Novosphingobium endophyticum]|uniref:Lipoprotein n=2 Tax=Novosphingobium endophyticum TaxID=1955250 RepID=A0A916X5N5_9SPHN|nr:hypothetical protein GCM10011494_20530 [Novosphingobium endophyticum]
MRGLSKNARSILPLLVLAGCSSEQPIVPPVAEGTEHVACAVDGETELADACAVERTDEDGKLVLVIRHPGGAFRRFAVLTDGRGIAVADGADEAATRLDGGALEVTVGDDRYLFPATLKPGGESTGGADAR